MTTTFRRQLAMILCLLFGATLLIGLSFWALFTRSAEEEREQSLHSTAQSVSALLDAYSIAYLSSWDFRTNLSVAAASSDNDILICDPEGKVLICSRELQYCDHIGRSIGKSTAKKVLESGYERMDIDATRLYDEGRIAIAIPAVTDSGFLLGIVVVSVEQASLSALTGKTLRIFSMTALLVLLIAFLATPYLARRESKPIKEMALAARHIARGNYQVRVPTGHHNEEIEELAVAFNNMTLALQNSDVIRQEFVANVSHELKTPMTTIAGYLDGMLDGTIPQEKHRYYMELVATEVRRLSRLVRNMLDVSRLKDQGIPEENKVDFDICEAAGQALLSFEQRINRKNLNVEIDMPDYGITVHALPDAVTQVLYNLMDNSVKFVEEGGSLWVRAESRGSKALITVGNTGPTISPSELPLLFDRFHKTDKSRSDDRDGAGLGLYIVKTIVNAHGEDIYVTSREGRTEFIFTMPLGK